MVWAGGSVGLDVLDGLEVGLSEGLVVGEGEGVGSKETEGEEVLIIRGLFCTTCDDSPIPENLVTITTEVIIIPINITLKSIDSNFKINLIFFKWQTAIISP